MRSVKMFLLLLFLLITSLLIVIPVRAGILNESKLVGKIQDFKAADAPYDDGAGIVLSWKPLPKELRIIQYRIYRGIHPDSLFYFGQVDVDPVAGVAAERMYYYDKDYQSLLSIDSPAKLKKEKHQNDKSPLYAAVPRDPAIIKKLLPYFSVLGVYDAGNFFKRSVMIKNTDGTVSAGLKVTHFEQLAANPNPDTRYYYTVLAVNEKGNFLPYADIRSAIPVDNPPDTSSKLSSVFLTDIQEFRFEWITSISSFDIAQWQFWLLPKSLLPAFEQWQDVYLNNNGAPAPWTAKAILLTEKSNDYSNYLTLTLQNSRVVNPDGSPGVIVPVNNLNDYVMILGVQDYSGFYSYSLGKPLRFMTSKQLPSKTVFTVSDKPDDKGDINTISFGLPISYLTNANYVNSQRTKIRINYEISDNVKYKVEGIVFRVYDNNENLITTITERYPDKIITLKLPKTSKIVIPAKAGILDVHSLHFKMAFRFKGSSQLSDFYVHQKLAYDSNAKRFITGDIYYKEENLSRYYYQIFRRNLMQSGFNPTKKISAISRNYDDIINFESTLNNLISGIDLKTGRLLLDAKVMFAVDKVGGIPLMVNIFRAEQIRELKKMQDELATLRQQLETEPGKADSLNQVISSKETYIKALTSHPVYKQASTVTNPKKWLALFRREQQNNARSYAYSIMKTDNEGAYTFSDESTVYFPVANWFNWAFFLALISSVIFTIIVVVTSFNARRGRDLYLRPIAGLTEIDNAVGRATEMGRPILYVPGWSTIGEITTIASMMILNKIAKKAAEYDTRLLVPNSDYYVMPLAQEMVREGFYEAGRPDSYNPIDIFYISSDQFPYAAGVNGTMIREKCSTNFFMGYFNAEALLMTETGNATGAIQIAGTDAITQVPFFITTCDYTLIGEEFYAASAYLSKDSELIALLKAQDYFKFLIVFFILLGALLATLHFNWLTNSFPLE